MKIGFKLSLGLFSILVPMTLIYYVLVLHLQSEDVGTSIREKISHIEMTFQNLKERDTSILASSLEVIVRDPSFKKIYMQRNREKLFDFGQPLFQSLKGKYGITHFYFILPDGRCFVRLHNREIHGDEISRFTFWMARDTRDVSSGIELGKTAFALRVVRPYYKDKELIGYVELGEEIEHFLEILKRETGNEFGIIADKQYLDREKWHSVRQSAGLRNNWNDLENHVVLAATADTSTASECFTEENVKRAVKGENVFQRFRREGRDFVCSGFEIQDAGGRSVGAVLSLIDITDRMNIAERSNFAALGLISLLLAFAIIIGFFVFRSISLKLCEFREAAAEIASGNLDKKVSITTTDELGHLADTFNVMTNKLKESHIGLEKEVNERKKAEAFITNILESVGEGIIVIDPEYRIISANQAYCNLTGLPIDKLRGRHCHEIAHARERPCFENGEDCPARKTFETGAPTSTLHEHRDAKGAPIYVEIESYPMKDPSGKVISVIEVINDITERRRLEDQLRQSQKMEAVGTLTGGIAHDFNNLLTTIIGYSQFLQEDMREDDPLRSSVDMILTAGEKAASLTRSLLAFSRKQLLHPDEIDLNEVIRKIEKLLVRLIGEDIEITLNLTKEPLTVMADGIQIEQVLMNLATNARDAMPKGGSFFISTGTVEFDRHFIDTHGYGKPGRYAQITVSDTGEGMDEKTKNQIFEPFFTTKEVGRGTGLGLAVAYGIIKQHNGYINVYSEPGQGTTFNIYIPLIRVSAEVKKAAKELAPLKGGTETVLLAEDDANVREFIKTVLEKFGYTVMEAVNGEDAVRVFQDNRDAVQLLLFDVIMPKKNGIEALKETKKSRPDVKAILLSGYPMDILRKYEPEEEIILLQKPISPSEIIRKVREILDK